MPTLTRYRRAQLAKKMEQNTVVAWLLMVLVGLCLFYPLFTAESAFYNDAAFPYSRNAQISNLSANQAFALVKEGLGQDNPMVTSSNGNTLAFVVQVMNFILGFYFVVAVGILIYHGILVLISRGSDEKRKTALKAIVNIFIATAVVLFSYIIVRFVVEFFRNPSSVIS